MKTKGDFFDRLKYHMKEVGAPHTLQRDGSKEQWGSPTSNQEGIKFNTDHFIKDEYSEAKNQQQTPAELHAVPYLKHHGDILMNRCGVPNSCWLLTHKYIATIQITVPKGRRVGPYPFNFKRRT